MLIQNKRFPDTGRQHGRQMLALKKQMLAKHLVTQQHPECELESDFLGIRGGLFAAILLFTLCWLTHCISSQSELVFTIHFPITAVIQMLLLIIFLCKKLYYLYLCQICTAYTYFSLPRPFKYMYLMIHIWVMMYILFKHTYTFFLKWSVILMVPSLSINRR